MDMIKELGDNKWVDLIWKSLLIVALVWGLGRMVMTENMDGGGFNAVGANSRNYGVVGALFDGKRPGSNQAVAGVSMDGFDPVQGTTPGMLLRTAMSQSGL
jgi:hypothetical protein